MPQTTQPTPTQALSAAIQSYLEAKRLQLNSEIQNYPTPIPHCDQGFNWLLDQRDAVTGELYRLESLNPPGAPFDLGILDAFLRSCPFLDGAELRERIEGLRREVLSELEHYPTPIFRTDVQFSGLLEQRDTLAGSLALLDVIAGFGGAGSPAARPAVATVPR